MFDSTGLYNEILNSKEDIIVCQGGTYSSKTYSILQVLNTIAIREQDRYITIVGESIPNLKKGAMRDNDRILASSETLRSLISGSNKADRIINFSSGSLFEFTSYVTSQDAHSGKRDYLFLNEAPGISWEIAEQLINRTDRKVYIDYNPSIPFWVHEKLLKSKKFGAKTVKLIISDHRHNHFLTKEQHEHIEERARQDPGWGKVYARGLTGKVEGLIFRNWVYCDEIPKDAELIANGMDFGFTNDPTAAVAVYRQNGELWIRELLYDKELTNEHIYNELKENRNVFICDSAEPKSIQELKNFGLKVEAAQKGHDSIKSSIDILKRFKINVTRDSVNFIKELNRYKWKVDRKTGVMGNEPVDDFNHAIDALRYVALNRLSKKDRSFNYDIDYF